MNWDKVPSVTNGGKPYFWNCWIDGRKKYSVVWNRVKEKWFLVAYADRQKDRVLGEFDSDKTAMEKAGGLK